MKQLHYIIVAAAALTAGLSSCNDVLDVNNTTQFSDAIIWSKSDIADGYVVAAYNTLADYTNILNVTGGYYDAYTDLYKSTSWDQYNALYNKTWMETTRFGKNNAGVFGNWGTAYGRIKRTNLLLNDIDRYGGKFGEEWQEIRRAEARFCNALNYWLLARVYGGVVLRTHYSGVTGLTDDGAYEEDMNRARLTEEQTYDYILSELQWAADRVPDKWEERFTGRATKGMVYAFMSRIALFAKKWDVAAEAADKCKEYGDYELIPDYAQLFKMDYDNANRKEVIHARYFVKDVAYNGEFDSKMRPFGDGAAHKTDASSMAQIVPTAELADMYEYKDGTEFNWDTWKSKRDDANKKIPDPYSYREPRFHATILYNGAPWENRTIETFVGQNANVKEGDDCFAEWKTAASTQGHTCTGYYVKKYLSENNNDWRLKGNTIPEIYIRYAEVLLNKAEALGELGRFADALVPLNEVRARVGLPAKKLSDVPDLEAFRKVVRKERTCELAGEGHRFWDLRRWGIAKDVISQPVHGVKITKSEIGTLTYTTVDVDANTPRIYQDRYDYFSLPADELTNNKLCVDNPGW